MSYTTLEKKILTGGGEGSTWNHFLFLTSAVTVPVARTIKMVAS